jgi:hypothetical protein
VKSSSRTSFVAVHRKDPAGPAHLPPEGACAYAAGTVKIHVSNILSKLAARDRTQAVLRALELRLL